MLIASRMGHPLANYPKTKTAGPAHKNARPAFTALRYKESQAVRNSFRENGTMQLLQNETILSSTCPNGSAEIIGQG
jgi:hypothetical protein